MSRMSKTIAILGVVAGLGVAALPLSTYAADPVSKDTTVKLTIDSTLTLALSKDTTEGNEVDLTSENSFADSMTATVTTNNATGYSLNLKGSGKKDAIALVNSDNDKIEALVAPFAAPVALDASSNSVWGYSVSHDADANMKADITTAIAGFGTDKYAGVTADGEEIMNIAKPTATTGDVTTVNFKAALKTGQASGIYLGQVTFTASENPATVAP